MVIAIPIIVVLFLSCCCSIVVNSYCSIVANYLLCGQSPVYTTGKIQTHDAPVEGQPYQHHCAFQYAVHAPVQTYTLLPLLPFLTVCPAITPPELAPT
jgi:hypothetical protein